MKILNILINFKKEIALVIVLALLTSWLELLGVSLFIPVLQNQDPATAAGKLPFPMGMISDFFRPFSLVERLRWVAVLLILTVALKGIASYAGALCGTHLETVVTNFQTRRCFRLVVGSKLDYFQSYKGSHLMTIMRQHAGQFGNLVKMLTDMVPAFMTFALLVFFLLMMSWKLTLLAFGFFILASLLIQVLKTKSYASGKVMAQAQADLDSSLLDAIHGLRTVKLSVREQAVIEKFYASSQHWADTLVKQAKILEATRPVFEVTSIVGVSLLLLVFAFSIGSSSAIPMSFLLGFLLVFFRLLPPMTQLNRTRVSFNTVLPICEKVEHFIQEASQYQETNSPHRPFQELHQEIRFEKVTFSYKRTKIPALKEVSLIISKGAKVGIIGASGSGKSTLADLLQRFYDPQEGTIFIDDQDLQDFDLSTWRHAIGVVSQDTFLFNDTIANNIAFVDPQATTSQIEQAARQAHIHDFILTLPKGYGTLVGDRGVFLSGGQRQRIAIARAILTKPQILIFDEATSALDTESEKMVQATLDEIARGRTLISIAHRLSTIMNSDIIFVLDGGRLVEQGRHIDLVKNQEGIYSKLVRLQSLDQEAAHSLRES